MDVVHALVLAIIEGITEFLPISSTGHLILTTRILGLTPTEFTKSFDIIIQLGAIMAVLTLYWQRIRQNPAILRPVVVAFLPTALVGLILYPFIKRYLLGNDTIVVAALAIGGIILILLEHYWKHNPPKEKTAIASLSPRQAMMVGVFQVCSIIPGVSRAAATIVGGICMGLSKREAVEFSFLLALPTMAAATGLDVVKNIHLFSGENLLILVVGFIAAWIAATVTIRVFLAYLSRTTFTVFGLYRIVIAGLYWLLILV